jgi:hypothetical protein
MNDVISSDDVSLAVTPEPVNSGFANPTSNEAQPDSPALASFHSTTLSESQLVSATVRFQTLNDNKDRNSVVTVTVRDATNGIIVFVDNIFDEFKDRRLYGPYDMHVLNSAAKSLVRPGGSLTVYFVQNANDEWHTNLLVDLAFSDGSHIAVEEQDLSFTGDHPKQIFGL